MHDLFPALASQGGGGFRVSSGCYKVRQALWFSLKRYSSKKQHALGEMWVRLIHIQYLTAYFLKIVGIVILTDSVSEANIVLVREEKCNDVMLKHKQVRL